MTINQLCETLAATQIGYQTNATKGTALWMAPETITEQKWSDKTDVYAFGLIMWEIFSGQVPFIDGQDRSQMDLLGGIVRGDRPSMSVVSHISRELRELMQACWHPNPKRRPSMKQALDRLRGNDPREIFKEMDVDNSGGLSFGEFVIFMERYAPDMLRQDQVHMLFQAIDSDGSGDISIGEFEVFWRQVEMNGFSSAISAANGKSRLNHPFIVDSLALLRKY